MENTNKHTTVFVPVLVGMTDWFTVDIQSITHPQEIADYLVKRGCIDHLIFVEDCPLDCEQLNSWDDFVLMDDFDNDEDEFRACRREMSELLNVEDSDYFLREHWAVDVSGTITNFKKYLRLAQGREERKTDVK